MAVSDLSRAEPCSGVDTPLISYWQTYKLFGEESLTNSNNGFVYELEFEYFSAKYKKGGKVMDMSTFECIWNKVGDKSRMTSNSYRVFVEVCLNGATTQSDLCKKRNWKMSSISNTMKKLYDMGLVECRLENRRILYLPNLEHYAESEKGKRNVDMDMETFCRVWKKISDMNQMTSNCYRVFIDICLYGPTTQKELWERRNWKIAGVNQTFHRLYDMGVLDCKEENGKKIYFAKVDSIITD